MDPLNFETDLHSLRRLYGLLHSNASNESIPQAFLLDDNTQFLLKRLLDSATEELLARQTKILAQVQLGLPTPSKKNAVSRSVIKLPSKVGLTEEVVDSIERIETQLSAFSFCSTRDDRTKTCKSRNMQDHSSRRLSDKALMGRRQSYQASVSGLRNTRTSNIAPRLRRVNNNAAACDHLTLNLDSQGSSTSPDDQVVLVRSRQPLPPRPKPRESNRMKPTLLDQETETWDEESGNNTRSGTSSQVSTDQESETGSTTGSSWQTRGESITESEVDSSYPSESDDNNSQVSDSPPHERRPEKQRKKSKGRFKRFKEKLGKVFHHHHYHHHHHENKEQGHKPSPWKKLVKKHLQKDKEKLVERKMESESKGLVTKHKNKGGQFHALVEGLVRHRRRHSKITKQSHVRKKMKWWKTRRRHGGIKFPQRGRAKLGKTNYLCNKDQEHDEN